jgi:uncharacterized protein (DUF3820 family)
MESQNLWRGSMVPLELGDCCAVTWTDKTASVQHEGVHRVARCPTCHRWLQALPQPLQDVMMPFGKYKGVLIADLWTQDRDYCEWLLTVDWLRPRMRAVLEGTKP